MGGWVVQVVITGSSCEQGGDQKAVAANRPGIPGSSWIKLEPLSVGYLLRQPQAMPA